MLNRNLIGATGLAVAFSIAASSASAVVISDDFSSGNLSGGTGWVGDWQSNNYSHGTTPGTLGIDNANPINGGGQYLVATQPPKQGPHSISRQMTDLDINGAPITYSFDFRVDSYSSNENRQFTLGDYNSHNNGTGNNTTFNVAVRGPGYAPGSYETDYWAVYNGTGIDNSHDANRWVDTGILVEEGGLYHMTIVSDPLTRTYTVEIDDGTTTFQSGALNWRTTQTEMPEHLIFGTRWDNAFSLDNVQVTQDVIPEPASLALIGMGGLLMLRRRRA